MHKKIIRITGLEKQEADVARYLKEVRDIESAELTRLYLDNL